MKENVSLDARRDLIISAIAKLFLFVPVHIFTAESEHHLPVEDVLTYFFY